jgi:hypothetical protein
MFASRIENRGSNIAEQVRDKLVYNIARRLHPLAGKLLPLSIHSEDNRGFILHFCCDVRAGYLLVLGHHRKAPVEVCPESRRRYQPLCKE